MKTTIERYKLDKSSEAIKLMKKVQFFKEALEDDADRFDFASKMAQLGLDYGLDDQVEDADEEIIKTVTFYGVANLRAWCSYQQTYCFAEGAVMDAAERIPAEATGDDVLLPFPALMAIVDVSDGKVGFLMHQVGDRIDVIALVGEVIVYFPLDDDVLQQLEEERAGGFLLNDDFITLAGYAYFIAIILSVYRNERKILKVNRVFRRGKPKSNELKASEWRVTEESTITEKLPDTAVSLKAAFNLDDLIPPSEREEEVVESESTHASPRRHHVRTHTCVYWTGPGRKIPVVRVIQSYERGGRKNDSVGGTKRKIKTKDSK